MWLLNLGLGKDVALWLARVTIVAGVLITVYASISVHHYNRGWNAHERAAQQQIREINAARDKLNAELANERLTREARIRAAVDEALDSLHVPVNLVGGGAEPVSSDTIAKLNKIR